MLNAFIPTYLSKAYFWGFLPILLSLLFGCTTSNSKDDKLIAESVVPLEAVTFQTGDLIFQTSQSSQSQAIQIATNSIYSHVGILYEFFDEFYVLEAIQPVSLTPLESWIKRGEGERYALKRLINEDLFTERTWKEFKLQPELYVGKDYDLYFEWSDDRIYCSELVWKIYKDVLDIELGKLESISNFDLSHPAVLEKIRERYGHQIPMDELVISPQNIFDSEWLFLVESN